VPRHPDARRGEVVHDEPARGGVFDDEPARGGVVDDEPSRGGVVDDEPRDELHHVPRHPDARRRKIDSALTVTRRLASMDLGESMSRLILLTRVLRIRLVVMITPTWRASCQCFRPANLPRGYLRY
jgi:hypothetical protein